MEENKNLENLQNENVENNNAQSENIDKKTVETENIQPEIVEKEKTETVQTKKTDEKKAEIVEPKEKKKSSAEILLEKLQKRKSAKDSGSDSIEELKKISQEVKTVATPDTVIEKVIEKKAETKNMPNYNDLSREELVASMKDLLEKPLDDIKEEAEIIKNTFYKKRNSEIVEKREKFVEAGGVKEDFKVDPDEFDNQFKDLYDKFRELKQQQNEQIKQRKVENLENKNTIINNIEDLINSAETLNKTFDDFHKYRDEWDKIGSVPQEDSKALLEKYNHTLQKFYDWVKINKELRDLDLKKNLEHKIQLCEQTEALILEPKITKAYNILQRFHENWKEIGPVPTEQKEEIWERFKEASSLINKRHYTYFQEIKQQQEDNLKAKEMLCEEAESIASIKYEKSKEWHQKTDEINELMKLWKLIGFAPKKDNNQVFSRFISARKIFFDNKHEYFKNYREILDKNLQIKEQLAIEAENIKDSTDWKKSTDLLIKLQDKWKKTGPVPNDKKDLIWNRFHKACNTFFENKRDHFKNRKDEEQENLNLKNEIIKKIKNLEDKGDASSNLKAIQELQNQWAKIGYVPFKAKDAVYKEYHAVLDEKYNSLDISKEKREEIALKNQFDNVLKSNQPFKLREEIEKVKNKIDKINGEIITLENNLTFFVKSKNAEGILKNFDTKLKKLKAEKEQIEKVLKTLVKALREAEA